jgi:hypothetical protein
MVYFPEKKKSLNENGTDFGWGVSNESVFQITLISSTAAVESGYVAGKRTDFGWGVPNESVLQIIRISYTAAVKSRYVAGKRTDFGWGVPNECVPNYFDFLYCRR